MEYLVDPDIVKQEEELQKFETFETEVCLRKDHIVWLYNLINYIPQSPADLVHFCVTCSRYLTMLEDPVIHKHQDEQNPHHLFPLVRVQRNSRSMEFTNCYVSAQALIAIQLPIGDVLSYMLPHPARHMMTGVTQKVSCMFVYPQTSPTAKWQNEVLSGRCAYPSCQKVFPNRQSHLRQFGVTPQFCCISCKIKTWFCCNEL